MFTNLYAAAEEIRTLLMPFAFLLCVIGIGEMGWKAGSDTRAILGAVLKSIVIVTLIASYPQIMKGGQSAFMEMRNKFTNAQDAKFTQLLRSSIQNQPSDSLSDIGKIIPAAIGSFFQGIGRFMLVVLRFFQEFAIAGMVAVSPLLIGFLFFSYTQTFGVQFGVTSLTVLLWNVAICLVDITIAAISDVLFYPVTAGGIVQVGANMIMVQNWIIFPLIMAFASLITVFFYLSVPFVASALMKGASATTAALTAGIQGSLQAAGLAVGTGLTVAGAAATMGGSTAIQAAMGATQAAGSAAGSAGRIANDVLGSVSGGKSTSGRPSSVPPPPPIPAAVGETMESENYPAMAAEQSTPYAFTVKDSSNGTTSQHKGNLSTPYAAKAAFNVHSSKSAKDKNTSNMPKAPKTP